MGTRNTRAALALALAASMMTGSFVSQPLAAQPEPIQDGNDDGKVAPAEPAARAAFHAEYRGRVYVPEGPMRNGPSLDPEVIRDQAAYERFIARIPTHVIQMRQPAPPSRDPLLQKPAIDWDKHMLLVAYRGANMYAQANITRLETVEGELRVTVVLPPLGDTNMMQSQLGVGTYHAVVVDKFAGEVEFEIVRQNSDDEPDGNAAEILAIEESWSGRVHLPCVEPGAFTTPRPHVIRSQAEFERFLGIVPTHEITPQNPAPASNDPLLKRPAIDWDKFMLIVAYRGDNMYAKARVTNITAAEGKLFVTVVRDALGNTRMMASQQGIGTYFAVRVEKRDGAIEPQFIDDEDPADD